MEPSSNQGEGSDARKYYILQLKQMKKYELTTLYVDYTHLLNKENVLATAIASQYYRFLPYLRLALQNLVRKYAPDYVYSNAHISSTAAAGLQTREFSIAFYNMPIVCLYVDNTTF